MRPVTVEIIATRGSAPRDAGTAMVVEAEQTHGTIGGGALEYQAIAAARAARSLPMHETIPLGPDLGQCCGGVVTLRYSHDPPQRIMGFGPDVGPAFAPPGLPVRPLWLWGAGHVGRAVVQFAAPMAVFDVTWIDTNATRFPSEVPDGVTVTPSQDMPRLARFAPKDAMHLIFTYSHDFDLALCHAALQRGFGFCGLIGSATKWARFRRRLSAMGHADADIARITCPIGDKSLGKEPDAIATGVLRQLVKPEHWPGGTA